RHLLVVDEGFAMCGIGGEIAAVVMEHAFDELDAPVGRLHTDPVGHPFSPAHENAVVVSVERIVSAAKAVLARRPPIPRRLRGPRTRPQDGEPGGAMLAQSAKPLPPADSQAPGAGVAIIMPNLDLTISEARIIQWLKQVGDTVAKEEGVVEVETDKAVLTIEAPAAGRL